MSLKVNKKQKAFCNEYIIDFNGTQAAIRAGYSKNTAKEISYELLTKLHIQAFITDLQCERSVRTQVTQDRVLLEIARLAFNDPRKAFDANGIMLPIQQWPDEVAAAIQSIKITEQRIDNEDGDVLSSQLKEIKFWDKGKQIELAGKHLGMFIEKMQLTVVSPAEELVKLKQLAQNASRD